MALILHPFASSRQYRHGVKIAPGHKNGPGKPQQTGAESGLHYTQDQDSAKQPEFPADRLQKRPGRTGGHGRGSPGTRR